MYMGIGCPVRYQYSFLSMAKVARTPICVKDTVRYETSKLKNHELFVSFLNFSAYTAHSQTYGISSEEMDTPVYRDVVYKMTFNPWIRKYIVPSILVYRKGTANG